MTVDDYSTATEHIPFALFGHKVRFTFYLNHEVTMVRTRWYLRESSAQKAIESFHNHPSNNGGAKYGY